jgi:hypothetical protein
MVRDINRFKESVELHKKWQLDSFNKKVKRLIDKANEYKKQKNDLLKFNNLMVQADKMKFQFDKSTASINYGNCSKLNKAVSFIANQTQLKTQECFEHRRGENLT